MRVTRMHILFYIIRPVGLICPCVCVIKVTSYVLHATRCGDMFEAWRFQYGGQQQLYVASIVFICYWHGLWNMRVTLVHILFYIIRPTGLICLCVCVLHARRCGNMFKAGHFNMDVTLIGFICYWRGLWNMRVTVCIYYFI